MSRDLVPSLRFEHGVDPGSTSTTFHQLHGTRLSAGCRGGIRVACEVGRARRICSAAGTRSPSQLAITPA